MYENPFILFKNTVNVLVVDDMPLITSAVQEFLELFKIYAVSIANSTQEAIDLIEKADKRFHACLFDLGMYHIDGNEFHLLDTYGKSIPFIVLTSSEDAKKAFKCGDRGAWDFINKTKYSSFDFCSLIVSLNRFAMLNILYPEYGKNEQSNLSNSIDTLVNKAPIRVKGWFNGLKVSGRQIRNVWDGRLDLTPKKNLCVYKIFSSIFQQIDAVCANNNVPGGHDLDQCARLIMESADYKQWLDYYFLNINDITASITRLPRSLSEKSI